MSHWDIHPHSISHHSKRLPSMYLNPSPPVRPLLTHVILGNGGRLIQCKAGVNQQSKIYVVLSSSLYLFVSQFGGLMDLWLIIKSKMSFHIFMKIAVISLWTMLISTSKAKDPLALRPSASLIVINLHNGVLLMHQNPKVTLFAGMYVSPTSEKPDTTKLLLNPT